MILGLLNDQETFHEGLLIFFSSSLKLKHSYRKKMLLTTSCFVTAIGTDSGKTVVSAILAKALNATYWKPIQCGLPRDTETIEDLCGSNVKTLPERFLFQTPASPHFAAQQEGIEINLSHFSLPQNGQQMIVEGAGGLLVPINKAHTIADLVKHLKIPLILVINHYLGSLNHSLLTLEVIRNQNLPMAGLIFNGTDFQQAEPIILSRAHAPVLARIPKINSLSSNFVEEMAASIFA